MENRKLQNSGLQCDAFCLFFSQSLGVGNKNKGSRHDGRLDLASAQYISVHIYIESTSRVWGLSLDTLRTQNL